MEINSLDYSNLSNWLIFENEPTKNVDALWFYGTIAQVSDLPNGRADIKGPLRQAIANMSNRMATIFKDFTNVYCFCYRQLALETAMKSSGGKHYLDLVESSGVLDDVFMALDYYFQNVNSGRPFILIGHSQGSAIIQKTLEIYMKKHPEYLSRMVAAYAVGFSVTKNWLNENPHIKFARGEVDAGVMISWNTEGPGATKPNFVLQPGTILINPINWKTDETTATVIENKGSRVNNFDELVSSGKPFNINDIKDEIRKPGIADATIDLNRGSVICTTVTNYVNYENFGDRSLHTSDYDLYYVNVRENIQKRIETYFTTHK